MRGKTFKLSKLIWIIIILILIGAGIYFFTHKSKKPMMPIDAGKVTMGSIVNSVSADGVVEPVTSIEIKSNVGGTILKLYADEGDYVKAGQLLAQIDPVDVLTNLEKEQNNVVSAEARLRSAEDALALQRETSATDITNAKENIKSAEIKLATAKRESGVQPTLSNNDIATAKANLEQAKSALAKMQKATNNQSVASAKSSFDSAQASFNSAQKTYERNKSLLEKGYLSKKDFEASEESYISAKAQLANAREKYKTVQAELNSDIASQKEKIKSAQLALKTAQTNSYSIDAKKDSVRSAESALRTAKEGLVSAVNNQKNIKVKEAAVVQARADLASAKSALENAKQNYEYTNIKAPRDGVLVKKWTDEGSIVQSGKNSMSSNSQGVVIFELADITKMQVSVDVDETDVYNITKGQTVKVTVDAYPDKEYFGKVSRISASAQTESGVTTVPVEVVLEGNNSELKPEMNATCEFIVATKENILVASTDYVDVTGDMATTFVMGEDKKPTQVQFHVGLVGDEAVEVLDTLKEGQEILSPRTVEMMNSKGKKKNRAPGPPMP